MKMMLQCWKIKQKLYLQKQLKWNEGNHFKDSHIRCAKGFLWCLNNIQSFDNGINE